jgi:hypothetical protein
MRGPSLPKPMPAPNPVSSPIGSTSSAAFMSPLFSFSRGFMNAAPNFFAGRAATQKRQLFGGGVLAN